MELFILKFLKSTFQSFNFFSKKITHVHMDVYYISVNFEDGMHYGENYKKDEIMILKMMNNIYTV